MCDQTRPYTLPYIRPKSLLSVFLRLGSSLKEYQLIVLNNAMLAAEEGFPFFERKVKLSIVLESRCVTWSLLNCSVLRLRYESTSPSALKRITHVPQPWLVYKSNRKITWGCFFLQKFNTYENRFDGNCLCWQYVPPFRIVKTNSRLISAQWRCRWQFTQIQHSVIKCNRQIMFIIELIIRDIPL